MNNIQTIDTLLSQKLPSIEDAPEKLHQAMHYVVLNGGKRIRPNLVYLSGDVFNTPKEYLDNAACAVELLHAYSLVHDDLPAMDDDDLRRGKPTCHKAFDEATAILVGDGLQALAFELLSKPIVGLKPEKQLEMIRVLSKAVGSKGMVGGQSLDLSSEGKQLTLAEVDQLHRWKTGALIEASIELGILASDTTDEKAINCLRRYAHCLGLSFQIRDDIRDIEEDIESLGKAPGGDADKQKATYPAMIGLDDAKATLTRLHQEASDHVASFGEKAKDLRHLFDSLLIP